MVEVPQAVKANSEMVSAEHVSVPVVPKEEPKVVPPVLEEPKPEPKEEPKPEPKLEPKEEPKPAAAAAPTFGPKTVLVKREGKTPMGLVLDTQTFFPKFVMVKKINDGIVKEQNAAGGPELNVGDMITHVATGDGVKTNCLETNNAVKTCLGQGGDVTFHCHRHAWTIHLERSSGSKLGLVMKHHGDFALVTSVRDEGMVADFNNKNSSNSVRIDDVVLNINGKGTYDGILEEAKSAQKMTVEVLRPIA